MKWAVLSLIGLMLLSGSAVGEDPPSAEGLSFPEDHWLHGVDFSVFRQEALRRGVEVPELEQDLDAHLVSNFRYIFVNHVDSRFLLGRPTPKWVMERSVEVLDLNRRLEEKILEGQEVLKRKDAREMRRFLNKVKDLSGDLKNLFETRFREGPKSRLTVRMGVAETDDVEVIFASFLRVAENLTGLLSRRITDFFFGGGINVVSVTDLNAPSVTVLCRSLRKLSERCEERLQDL
ncbi:MAG TPA: hypothetical protein VLU25_21740 [Acidobacteriota bacterium]|nr:hypothetical protein [Acidobacteriota bacterium]